MSNTATTIIEEPIGICPLCKQHLVATMDVEISFGKLERPASTSTYVVGKLTGDITSFAIKHACRAADQDAEATA